MTLRVLRENMERIRHFASVLLDVDAACADDTIWKFSASPNKIERRHHVVEKIGGDAAGIVPVFAETEVAVGAERTLRRGTEPAVPVDVFRSAFRLDAVIP